MPLYQQGGIPYENQGLTGLPDTVKHFLVERMKGKQFKEGQREFDLSQALKREDAKQRAKEFAAEMSHKKDMLNEYYKPMAEARSMSAGGGSPVNLQTKIIIDENGNRVYALFNPRLGTWEPTGVKAPEDPFAAWNRRIMGDMGNDMTPGEAAGYSQNVPGGSIQEVTGNVDEAAENARNTWAEHQRGMGASQEDIDRDRRLTGGVIGPVRVDKFTGKVAKTINGKPVTGAISDSGQELYPGDRFIQGQTVYEIDSVDAATGEVKATPVDRTAPARKK